MVTSGTTDHWWLEPDEAILREQATSARYQYSDSIVRRRLQATFFLTDQRLVASRKRGRIEQKQILPMDVPLDKLQAFSIRYDMSGHGSYYRPFPGRRILLLEIDHKGNELIFGIVLKTAAADIWLTSLSELRPDIEIPIHAHRT